ncbi:hypothetical protein J4Q44_G00043110 [Coregonus suidteri]|uniref:Uncharacterized protein n=1 Tax=Coregonus suidteri TaxID=861788 RepID=A0AAN8M8Y6_9TELE
MTLIFKNQTVVPNATSAEQGLTQSLAQGNTFLNVDTTSISAITTTTAPTTAAEVADTTASVANTLKITMGIAVWLPILFTMLTGLFSWL